MQPFGENTSKDEWIQGLVYAHKMNANACYSSAKGGNEHKPRPKQHTAVNHVGAPACRD